MRNRPKSTLGHSPLVLVLAQLRFSPLMLMTEYIPKIQDRLRLAGYPFNASGQYQEVAFGLQGVSASARPHWEFLSKDRRVSVVVSSGFVVVQTSAYDCFEDFLQIVTSVMSVVASAVDGLLVQRVGLRYVNLIRPTTGESWEAYVQNGLHGFASSHFLDDTALHLHQVVTRTASGTMIVRLLQNRDQAILPPDLATQNLMFPHVAAPSPGELLTLVDIDHFHDDEPEDFNPAQFATVAWPLKNASYEVFYDSLVTNHAIEVWT
jgi:uncharacterized protein (TIGR04255 family)